MPDTLSVPPAPTLTDPRSKLIPGAHQRQRRGSCPRIPQLFKRSESSWGSQKTNASRNCSFICMPTPVPRVKAGRGWVAGANPSYPGQVTGQHTNTNNHSHPDTHTPADNFEFQLASHACFRLREEAGGPRKLPLKHRDLEAPHRKAAGPGFNSQPSGSEATEPITAPPCHPGIVYRCY